jgi:hypothetical protein
MKRSPNMFFAIAVIATLVTLTASTAYASDCTESTLNATYAFTDSGFAIPHGRQVAVPVAALGTLVFDGAGNVSFGTLTLVFNGNVSSESGAGTYTVNSDCTGSISLTSGSIAGITFNLSIVAGGAEVFGVLTSPGNTQTFDAKKQ